MYEPANEVLSLLARRKETVNEVAVDIVSAVLRIGRLQMIEERGAFIFLDHVAEGSLRDEVERDGVFEWTVAPFPAANPSFVVQSGVVEAILQLSMKG
jgi:hypothetical protein